MSAVPLAPLTDPTAPATTAARTIVDLLAAARHRLRRVSPPEAAAELAIGALLVDIRPEAQRRVEGEIAGSLIIERNVLEWRLDPRSEARIPEASSHHLRVIVFCSEGYTSSLAAATLQDLGLHRATDLDGGIRSWCAFGLPTVAGGTQAGRYVPQVGRGVDNRPVRVSARVDYAVRALTELAAAGEEPVKGEVIATRQDIPLSFLENILRDLRRAGAVDARRGASGGYRLARAADGITVADVIRIVEGPLAVVHGRAPEDVQYAEPAAALREVWVAVRANLRAVLETVTIADVADGRLPEAVTRLVGVPDAWARR